MQKKIDSLLETIEKKEHIHILGAAGYGGRLFGMNAPGDSVEISFVFRRGLNDYLSLRSFSDSAEGETSYEGIRIKAQGRDVRRVLKKLRESDFDALCMLSSPDVRRTSPEFEGLRALASGSFVPRMAAEGLLGQAERFGEDIFDRETVKLKRYLLMLRPMLSAQWIIDKRTMPPLSFEVLAKAELPELVRPEVIALLTRKRAGEEVGSSFGIPVLNGFMQTRLSLLRRRLRDMDEPYVPYDKYDVYFRSLFGM